jgi:hypothetical protein
MELSTLYIAMKSIKVAFEVFFFFKKKYIYIYRNGWNEFGEGTGQSMRQTKCAWLC